MMKTKITISILALLLIIHFGFSQTIETVGIGAYNTQNSTLTFTNIDNIDHVVVEAIFKATSQGMIPNGPVTFSDADESYDAEAQAVEYLFTKNGTDYGASPHFFQATFNTVDANGISLDQLNNLGGIHSFIAYVYRNVDNGFTSTMNTDHAFFFWNGENTTDGYSFPLDIVDTPRDLSTKITISEMAYDNRICVITVSAGGISVIDTISQPDPALGAALNIVPITLTDVPGDATELTVHLYSPSTPYNSGDSFITGGVVLDVESTTTNPPEVCTLTQGFYGNYGGIFNGQTTSELLWDLLSTDLYLGAPGHSLTLTQDNVDCLIGRLPGGGKPAKLKHDATCENPWGIKLHKDGRFKNSLLAQAITLGLNLRLDADLGPIILADIDFLIPNKILQKLAPDATIDDLFALANNALAGGNTMGVKKGAITTAMGHINDYFDECAIFPPPPPPPGDCGPCDGQMTSLTLQYQGNETNATIKVYKDKVQPDKLIATFTDVNPGDSITFVGTGNDNKLGAKVRLTINDGSYTEIHTSCSQPIAVGMVYDDFLLVAGISHDGGPLCEDGGNGGGGDCGPCDGQMTSLTLEYLGNIANATIKVYSNKVQPDKLIATFANVNMGDSLSFVGTNNGNKLGAKVRLTINNNCNYTEIHTSCSQPIEVGMVYDNKFLLLAGTSHDGGPLCDDGTKSGSPFFTEMETSYAYLIAYPNPMVDGTAVEFEVSEQAKTTVEVINMQGQVVSHLYNGNAEPGNKYSVFLDASKLNNGIYFLRMVNGSEIINKKISVIR